MIMLKLLVLLSQGSVLLLEVLHLLSFLLFECVHLPLQGDDQNMIVRHLTQKVHHGCGTLISEVPMIDVPSVVDACSLWWFFLLGFWCLVTV